MIIVELPWPPRDLSPNVRRHWAVVANAKKRYRRDCKYATLAAGGKLDAEVKEVRLDYVFHPPGNYGYDKDNLIASLKSGVDGISDALGIDDKYFHFGEVEIGAVSKGGKVRVFISSDDTTEESDA